MSDFKNEVERVKGQFNSTNVRVRNTVIAVVLIVIVGALIFFFKG